MLRKWILLLVGLSLLAGATGCGGSVGPAEPAPEGTVPPVVREAEGKVIAEAKIEPARWSELLSPVESGGLVIQVPVEEGDVVSKGDLLVQIDPTDAELAVQRAEAASALAQAELAEAKGWARPEEIAVTEAQLEAAKAELARAVAQRDQLRAGEAEVNVAGARAALASATAEERQAYNQHERTLECFDFTLPDGSEHTICPALGVPEEQTRFAMHAAQDQLEAARVRLEATQNQAEAQLRDANAGVWAAVSQRDALQSRLDLQKAGSTAERIAAAEARVAQAEASLEAAKAALERTEIRAPFEGTVAELSVNVGDTAAPGQVLAVVATLDHLEIRTEDLTELDVVRVAVGQPVEVTLDALPDRSFEGHVACIDQQSVDYRGDVTYPVIVELDEEVPEMRWGMTVLVEIASEVE